MGYLFLAPGLILFFVFQIWPLLRGFVMAFTDFAFLKQLTEPAHFVGLSNFIEFFTDDNYFWPSFGRSLTFTAFYLPIMLFLGLFMASAIARVGSGRVAAFFRTSVYLPGRCLPMLPPRLSNDLCCLREGQDRLCQTVRFTVTPDGELTRPEANGSVIRSRRRCTYREVFAWQESARHEWPGETAPFAESLELLF